MRNVSPVRHLRPTPDIDVIIVADNTPGSLRKRSLRDPGALVIDCAKHRMARDGIIVEVTKLQAAFITVLASRPGAVVPKDEMMDLLYGHLEDGGPLGHRMVHTLRHATGAALAALGFRVETEGYRGQWLRCCLAPLSFHTSAPSHDLETVNG